MTMKESKMKKMFVVFTVLILLISFIGCSSPTNNSGDDDNGMPVDNGSSELDSKKITIIIHNSTYPSNTTPSFKINGVRVYVSGYGGDESDSVNQLTGSYLIGDTNTFDTSYTAELGASITIPDIEVSEMRDNFYPFIHVVISYGEERKAEISGSIWEDEIVEASLITAYPAGIYFRVDK